MRNIRRNLIHWASHITLCSAPSFFIAYTSGYDSPHSVAAMCLGVVIFIVFYTAISSLKIFQRVRMNPILSRSIQLGTYIRTGISLLGGLGLILGHTFSLLKKLTFFFMLPDIYSGLMAISIVEFFGKCRPQSSLRLSIQGDDAAVRFADPWVGNQHSFFPTLATVIIEGLIISVSLLIICSVLVLILRFIRKYKAGKI